MHYASLLLSILLLVGSSTVCGAQTRSPSWFDRAPLNTDTDLVGLPSLGVGRAYRYLAYMLNFAVLAAICYGLGKHEIEWSNFLYVSFGILLGSILLSVLLNPLLHIFTLIPMVALATFLLARFCSLRVSRALAAALLYQLYQIAYLVAYKAIAARYD